MAMIDDIPALESAIGSFPAAAALKVIPYLDPGALAWIERSPLFFAAFADRQAIAIAVGTAAGARIEAGKHELLLPLSALPGIGTPEHGMGFASLFLLPGLGETLRVNGIVLGVAQGCVRIGVSECYGHCAKALIRSDFWTTADADAGAGDTAFLKAVRFMALATTDADLRTDISPKGDPAGMMIHVDGARLTFADRPGNRRLDSFRNLIARPQLAMMLMAPGDMRVGIASGEARITTNPDLRERFAVAGKTPRVVVQVALDRLDIAPSTVLARAQPWTAAPVTDIDGAALFLEHVRRNRAPGTAAALARASLAIPGASGLFRRGLGKDYRDNLY